MTSYDIFCYVIKNSVIFREAEAFWQNRGNSDERSGERYYEKYQKKEQERMAAQSFESGSPRYFSSAMSEIESASVVSYTDEASEPTFKKDPVMRRLWTPRQKNTQELPVFGCRREILTKIDAYPVTVISGTSSQGFIQC